MHAAIPANASRRSGFRKCDPRIRCATPHVAIEASVNEQMLNVCTYQR